MQEVKFHCSKCGYAEKPTIKDTILAHIHTFFWVVGLVCVATALFLFVFFDAATLARTAADYKLSYDFTNYARSYQSDLRDIAVNVTQPCGGSFSRCYTEEIFHELKDIRYIPTSKYQYLYPPEYVLEHGGDCKNTATMVVGLMHSMGFNAFVDCSLDHKHCIAIVPNAKMFEKEYSSAMVVDLAYRVMFEIEKGEDPWDSYT